MIDNKDFYNGIQTLIDVKNELFDIGYLLRSVGLEKVADRIIDAGDALNEVYPKIRAYDSQIVNERLKESKEMTASILKVALAGCFKPPD